MKIADQSFKKDTQKNMTLDSILSFFKTSHSIDIIVRYHRRQKTKRKQKNAG